MYIQYLVPVLVICAVFGYMFYMKKSGKMGAWQQNMVDAEVEATERFDFYFNEFKEDEGTFRPIVKIIGGDFEAINGCKQPQGFKGAILDTARTAVTGVVIENTNRHLLVLQQDKLHYLEYNVNSKSSPNRMVFDRDKIIGLELGQGKLTDNLKMSMSVKLREGGQSGDRTDNSEMKKLSFEYEGKKHEFFVYDGVRFGDGFVVENEMGGMGMKQSVDDIVRGALLPNKLGKLFFDKIEDF